jgi:hypothetical protein
MAKKDKLIILAMLMLLVLIALSESRHQKINWFPSFAVQHKIPFGSYVAYNEAKNQFGKQFYSVHKSPYVYLSEQPDIKGTYVIYNSNLNLGKSSLKALLNWIKKGNNVLLASGNFEQALLDSLELKQNALINQNLDNQWVLKLLNPALSTGDTILFDKKNFVSGFKPADSLLKNISVKALGNISSKDQTTVNFIAVPYGKGTIMLHSLPEVFTNYFILKGHNLSYFEGLLSYINLQKPIYWDVQAQNGANQAGLFKYIMENPAFLWAYRLLFLGLLLYILFEGKRKQRAIPIIKPLKNETLVFTKTIADMYIENKAHKDMAEMHLKHFYDFLRNEGHLDISQNKTDLKRQMINKFKVDEKAVDDLFNLIEQIENSRNIYAKTVMDLARKIEKIKQQSKK